MKHSEAIARLRATRLQMMSVLDKCAHGRAGKLPPEEFAEQQEAKEAIRKIDLQIAELSDDT